MIFHTPPVASLRQRNVWNPTATVKFTDTSTNSPTSGTGVSEREPGIIPRWLLSGTRLICIQLPDLHRQADGYQCRWINTTSPGTTITVNAYDIDPEIKSEFIRMVPGIWTGTATGHGTRVLIRQYSFGAPGWTSL